MQRDHVVIVFDDENPDGTLCSRRGSWPSLFNPDEANEFVSEFSEFHENSQYRIFKLIEIGL